MSDDQQDDVHAHPLGTPTHFAFRLVVAPAAGRLRLLPPAAFHDGAEWVHERQALAIVESGPVSVEVRAPHEARVAGVLVRDGEPVAQGQPLVWLDMPSRRGRASGGEAEG